MTQNPITHKRNSKAKQHRFYCCSSSQSHSEAFKPEQTLASHCKFKTAYINICLTQIMHKIVINVCEFISVDEIKFVFT